MSINNFGNFYSWNAYGDFTKKKNLLIKGLQEKRKWCKKPFTRSPDLFRKYHIAIAYFKRVRLSKTSRELYYKRRRLDSARNIEESNMSSINTFPIEEILDRLEHIVPHEYVPRPVLIPPFPDWRDHIQEEQPFHEDDSNYESDSTHDSDFYDYNSVVSRHFIKPGYDSDISEDSFQSKIYKESWIEESIIRPSYIEPIKLVPNMFKMFSGISDSIDSVNKLASEGAKVEIPDLLKGVESFDKSVDKLTDSIKTAGESLSNIHITHEHKSSFFDKIGDFCKEHLGFVTGFLPENKITRDILIVFMVTAIHMYLSNLTGLKKVLHYTFLGVSLFFASKTDNLGLKVWISSLLIGSATTDLMQYALDYFMRDEEELETEESPELETNSLEQSTSSILSMVVSALIAIILGLDEAGLAKTSPYSVLKKCAEFQKLANGATFAIRTLADGFCECINLLTGPFGIKLFKNAISDYPDLYVIGESFHHIKQKFISSDRVLKADYYRFREMSLRLKDIASRIPNVSSSTPYKNHIDFLRSVERTLETRFRLGGVLDNGMRRKPYVFTLKGPSQIGKSTIQGAVANVLMPLLIGDSEMNNYRDDKSAFLAHIKPHEEFQENYRHGIVYVIVDDFMQMHNGTRDPKICHANWLVSVANTAPCGVPRAFGEKGEFWYNMDVISLSTNKNSFSENDVSLNSIEPLTNRTGDVFEVDIDEEFKTDTDPNNPHQFRMKHLDNISTEPYIFRPFSYKTTGTGQPIPPESNMRVGLRYRDWVRLLSVRMINHMFIEEVKLKECLSSATSEELNPFLGMDASEMLSNLYNDPPVFPGLNPEDTKGARLHEGAYQTIQELLGMEVCDPSDMTEAMKKLPDKWQQYACLCNPTQVKKISAMMVKHYNLFMMWNNRLYGVIELLKRDYPKHSDLFNRMVEIFDSYLTLPLDKIEDTFRNAIGNNYLVPISKGEVPTVWNRIKARATAPFGYIARLMEVVPDSYLEKAYSFDKDFFIEMDKEFASTVKWWTADSAHVHIMGTISGFEYFYAKPIKDLTVLHKYLQHTYQFISSISRRTGRTMVEVFRTLRKGTYKEAVSDGFTIIKRSIQVSLKECEDHLQNSFFSFLNSGVWTAFTVGMAIGLVSTAAEYLSKKDESGDLLINSLIRIKLKGNKSKKLKSRQVSEKGVLSNPSTVAGIPNLNTNSRDISNSPLQMSEKLFVKHICRLDVNDVPMTNLLFIRDATFIINDHSARHLDRLYASDHNLIIKIVRSSGLFDKVLYRYAKVTRFPERDLALVTFDRRQGIQMRRNILSYFMKNNMIPPDTDNICLTLAYTTYEENRSVTEYIPVQSWLNTLSYSSHDDTYLHRGFMYRVEGVPSSCMSPLWVNDNRFPGKVVICGLHTAGNRPKDTHIGGSTILCQELLTEMLEIHGIPESGLIIPVDDVLESNCAIPDKFPIVGKIPPLSQAEFSRYKKTPFFEFMGEGTNKKLPSVLQEHSVIYDGMETDYDPLKLALGKYNFSNEAINPELLSMAYAMYLIRWDGAKGESDTVPSVYTPENAIHGWDLVGPDKRDSSQGVTLMLRGVTKEMMYGTDGLRDLDTELMKSLISEVHLFENSMKEGIVPQFLNKGFLKSELLKTEKVLIGKARYISGADWFQLIIEKMYFGDLQSTAIRHNVENGMAMGINPYGHDWDAVGKMFLIHKNCFDGDFSTFDGHLKAWLFYMFGLFCRHHYYNAPESEHRVRDVLLWRICNSLHCVSTPEGWVIIMWADSLTSGCFITQLFGSFCDQILTRYNYLMSWCEGIIGVDHLTYDTTVHDKPKLHDLESNLYVLTLSDDHIAGVREHLFPWGAMSTQRNYCKIGFPYTAADKGEAIVTEYKTIYEMMFLRRFFLWSEEDNRFLAPLEDDSILHSLYWSEKGMKYFHQVVDTALSEKAIKGPKEHAYFKQKLMERAQKVGVPIRSPYLDYDVARAFVLNTTYAPWGELLL
jgi:hypothetical protein